MAEKEKGPSFFYYNSIRNCYKKIKETLFLVTSVIGSSSEICQN